MKKKESKKNKKSDRINYAPHRLYIFISFAFVFISGISALGAMYYFFLNITGASIPDNVQNFDRLIGILLILLFVGYVVGIYGILKPQPPLNNSSTLTSIVNLIFSILIVIGGGATGYLQAIMSAIHVYLGLRFPLDLSLDKTTLK